MTGNLITFVEDAGDKLHGQRNALDSGFLLDATKDYSNPANVPMRWLAEGRDASATLDADNAGFGKNDGDNELTGIHVSDGDTSKSGILGARQPRPFQPSDDERNSGAWRVFYTQQHGDNHDLGGRAAVTQHRSAGGRCGAGSRPPGYAAPR